MAVDPGSPPVTADSQAKDAVNFANVKNLGDMTPFAAGLASQALGQSLALAFQNAVDEQQNQRAFNRAVNGATINTLMANNIVQGLVDTNVSNSDLAKQLSQYQAQQVAGNQGAASTQQAAGIASDTSVAGLAQSIVQMNEVFANQFQNTTALLTQIAQGIAATLALLQAQANGPAPVPQPAGK